ncbi:MAG: homocysteine S-methyltransferase family protein [Elusimicrobiota bacterium]
MNKIVFLDGAMGTTLSARGADATPISNIEAPETVKTILKEYIDAGADIIETNTFSATSLKFDNFEEINRRGVRLAREAVEETGKKGVKIAGSAGATGLMVEPLGKLGFEEAVGIFSEQFSIFREEGVDLFIIETMDDISEMRAALIAARATAPEIPVIATMTFASETHTSTGTPAEAAAAVMDYMGASVVGINCSFGPETMLETVSRMRRVTGKPIIVQANAGLPGIRNGETVYHLDPAEYAKHVKKLIDAGASYVGGCCGTTPGHIRRLVKEFSRTVPRRAPEKVPLIITSRSGWAEFERGGIPVVIGERINFIAHRELADSEDKVVAEGLKQKKAGADALDINLGPMEEKTWDTVNAVSKRVDLPIVLDSQNPEEVEKTARKYPGIMLLNSVSGENRKMDELLPVVKKYGIPFVALCLDDKGVPKSIKGKLQVYRNILKRAGREGINTDRIIVDPLTLAVSSDPAAPKKTLKAIKGISHNTILGISNISMGMPQRSLLNEIFSVMAVEAGCSAFIVNPLDTDLMYALYAAALLSGREKKTSRYVRYFSTSTESFSFESPLSQAILEGEHKRAADEAKKMLKKQNALKIIDGHVLPALNRVGEDFRLKKIFLPQLIESARAAQSAMQLIEEKLQNEGREVFRRARILVATVKGDIHDIGKNLIALVLKNHSFEIRDIGVDVESEKIVDEACKWKADIIALSSLMTTTMERMKEVSDILKERGKDIPVMIGGAAITSDYADSIGAYYGRDAVEAVKIAGELAGK